MNRRITVFVGILTTLTFAWVAYLWATDELKFLGRETAIVTGTVVDIRLVPFKKGYIQACTYEFMINGEKFTGQYNGTYLTGKQKIGDRVRAKVAKHEPSISKRLATLRTSVSETE